MLNKGDCSAARPLTDEVEEELRFGRCRALLRRRQLLLGEQPIGLSSRAFDILMVLIQARGALVTKDEILSRVWPGIVVEENNLTVHIAALRKGLGQDKGLIQTVFGRGYRFIGTVTCVAADPVPAAPVSVPTAVAPTARAAERRQLSVVFCDLVGSTALSGRLDPEDMCEVIRAYQDACVNAVSCFEGHIIRYLGDGVLACFGWPKAHEDGAERAVRAALAAVEAVGALVTADGSPLAARAAIATGLVVVGDLIGKGAACDETVVGATPNLAARLQELAEPGSVVIAEGTRRLLGDLFVYRGLDPAQLKGFAEPVTAYHVLGEGAAESRFEAMHTAELTPLVGRDHEVALLLERWERAKEGDGQVVLLAGEAGIGKSRLVRAVRERLGAERHTPLSQFCSPYHTNSALHPVIGLLERSAGLRREDPPEHQLDRLEAMLACAIKNIRESAPLLADLLAIPGATGRYSLLQLSPQQQKKRTFQVLLDQLAGLAARQPVLAL
jgi:class 3 adenylate cyclase